MFILNFALTCCLFLALDDFSMVWTEVADPRWSDACWSELIGPGCLLFHSWRSNRFRRFWARSRKSQIQLSRASPGGETFGGCVQNYESSRWWSAYSVVVRPMLSSFWRVCFDRQDRRMLHLSTGRWFSTNAVSIVGRARKISHCFSHIFVFFEIEWRRFPVGFENVGCTWVFFVSHASTATLVTGVKYSGVELVNSITKKKKESKSENKI